MKLERKVVFEERKIKFGYGIEEWVICTLKILSKSTERKQ
jgi:hypothetical protein